PGGTGWGTAGRKCENWAVTTYPTSHAGYGWGNDGGDGYARITVVSVNRDPVAKNQTVSALQKKGAATDGTNNYIQYTSSQLATDNDAPYYGSTADKVYFANSKTDLSWSSTAAKLYLDANCTIDAKDYVNYTFTNNSTLRINSFKCLPRVTTGIAANNKITLYAVVRDNFSPSSLATCGYCVSSITCSFDTIKVNTQENKTGITYKFDPSGRNLDFTYRFGMSETGNATEAAQGKIYSKTHGTTGAKFAITVQQPLQMNTGVDISVQDLLSTNSSVKDFLTGYDKNHYQALFVPDTETVSSALPYSYTLPAATNFYAQSVTNPATGTAIKGYTNIMIRAVKASPDWYNPTWSIYIVEKTAAPNGTYNREPVGITYNGATTAIKVEVNFHIDNIRPVLDAKNNVVDVDIGGQKTVNIKDFFYDIDILGNNLTTDTHMIEKIVVPEYEFVQIDKYGDVVSTVGKGGANSNASYYNVTYGSDNISNAHETATGTVPTGFNKAIAYDRDNAEAGSSHVDSFMMYEFTGLNIKVTGLRSSYSQYALERTAASSNVYTKGSTSSPTSERVTVVNPGHFYLLVKIIDKSEVADDGIWLPIAFTVGQGQSSTAPKKPVSTGTATNAYSDQTVLTEIPSASGNPGDVFYFSPMGVTPTDAKSSLPIGLYEKNGELVNTGLQALAIDEDNFATATALSAWATKGGNAKLNELVTLNFGAGKATSDASAAGEFAQAVSQSVSDANNEKFAIIEPLELFIPERYFAVYGSTTEFGRIAATFTSTGSVPDGVKKLDLGNVLNKNGTNYYQIYGLKITLVSSTMNRWVYAKVSVWDSARNNDSTTSVNIGIRVNDTAPKAIRMKTSGESTFPTPDDGAIGNVAQATLSSTSEVAFEAGRANPTIRFSVPVKSTFMITPYDLVVDYDLYTRQQGVVLTNGFTLNSLSGVYKNGLFDASGNAVADTVAGDIEVKGLLRNISSYNDYGSEIGGVLSAINGFSTLKNVSAKPDSDTFSGDSFTVTNADDGRDNAYMLHDQDVYNDRLYFERTSYTGTADDAYLFDPYTRLSSGADSSGEPSFTVSGRSSLGSYADYKTGSAVKIGTATYDLDFVLIRTNTRTLQPLTLTLTVRDKFGASSESETVNINVIIDIVNSAPTIVDPSAVRLATSTDTVIDDKMAMTEDNVDINSVMEDGDLDTLSYIQSYGVIIANTPDLQIDLADFQGFALKPENRKYLVDTEDDDHLLSEYYVGAEIVSPTTMRVSAIGSTRNLKNGVYVYFFATDNRGGDSLGYKQVEVFNSKPVLNKTDDGFQTDTWSVESTSNSDISRTRYVASSETAASLLKKSTTSGGKGAVDADIKLIASDTDALHGAVLSPRTIGLYGGNYVNLNMSAVENYSNTDALRTALGAAVPEVTFHSTETAFPTSTGNVVTSGTPYAVLLYKHDGTGDRVGSPTETSTDRNYNAALWFSDGEKLINRDGVIEEIVTAAQSAESAEALKAAMSKYFDEHGRWVARDWALSLQSGIAMTAGQKLGMEFSIRDDARYGGDTAGLETAYNVDRTQDVADEKVIRSLYENGKNPFKVYLSVSGTGIRVKDEFAAYNDYYIVEVPNLKVGDEDAGNTVYMPTGSDGVKYSDATEDNFKTAYKYPSVIEIPSVKNSGGDGYKEVAVPMSFFGTMAAPAGINKPQDGNTTILYNSDYVGYNVIKDMSNPNATTYSKGVLRDIASAISLSDGVTTWTGTGAVNPLSANPYINIDTFDLTSDSQTAADRYFNDEYSKPFYNSLLAIPAVDDKGVSLGFDDSDLIANKQLMPLKEQAKNLIEHNFGLIFSKKDMRTGVNNLTLTIRLAKSQGNQISIGGSSGNYTMSTDTRSVSVAIKVYNTEFDLVASSGGDSNKLKYDATLKTYYTDVEMSSSGSAAFTLLKAGETAASGVNEIRYKDDDYSADGKYRDYAYFLDESINAGWKSDKSRPATLDGEIEGTLDGRQFVNTAKSVEAQASMANYYNADASTPNVQILGNREKLAAYDPNGGQYRYGGYFGLTLSNNGRNLSLNANNRTAINELVLKETVGSSAWVEGTTDTIGGITKSRLEEIYATRGLRIVFTEGSEQNKYTMRYAYYPLRILIYDSCGVGFNEASFVAMEFRIRVTNTTPTLKNVGKAETSGRRYSVTLAISQSVQINLYDIVNDHDIYEYNTGRNRLLVTEEQFSQFTSGIQRETGDYLKSLYSYVDEWSSTKPGGLTTSDNMEPDVSMWMPVANPSAPFKEKVPSNNYLNFTVNRRTTQLVDGKIQTKNVFEFPVRFYDSSGAYSDTIVFEVNVSNQTPYITTSETSLTMRVGDNFTMLTTYYENFVGGSAYVTGNGLVTNPEADTGSQRLNENEGSIAFKQSATKASWIHRQNAVSGTREDSYDKLLSNNSAMRCGDAFVSDTTVPGEDGRDRPANFNMGYIGLANDDTPWTLRIGGLSIRNNFTALYRDSVDVEGPANVTMNHIGITVTAQSSCDKVPLEVTVVDGETDGKDGPNVMVKHTFYITVVSTGPIARDWESQDRDTLNKTDRDYITEAHLETAYNNVSEQYTNGTYNMYLIPSAGTGKQSEIVNLEGIGQKEAFTFLDVYMTAVAKDPDGEGETQAMTLYNNGMFADAYGSLDIDGGEYIANNKLFKVRVSDDRKSFRVTATGYNPEKSYETLTFYIADSGNNVLRNALKVTLHIYITYSDMENSIVPAAADAGYKAYLEGSHVVHVKSQDVYNGRNDDKTGAFTATKYALVDLAGNNGTDGNTVSPIVDRDAAVAQVKQNYTVRLYALMKSSGEARVPLTYDELKPLFVRGDGNNTFKFSDRNAVSSYLIGGITRNGQRVTQIPSSDVDSALLSVVNSYVEFTFADDGASIMFTPVTATLDQKLLLYAEVDKQMSISRDAQRVGASLSAGSVFMLKVNNSDPHPSGTDTTVNTLSFTGAKGDSHTFKIHDPNDPYGSMFRDSDIGDKVIVEGFNNELSDADYRTALADVLAERPALDWAPGEGGKPRSFTVSIDNAKSELTITINRRMDEVQEGKYLDTVFVPIKFTGKDTQGGTCTTIINLYVKNTPSTAKDEFSSYSDTSGVGYTLTRDEGNAYTLNARVLLGESLNVTLDDFMSDVDYIKGKADTDSYMFVEGPESIDYEYLINSTLTVNHYLNRQTDTKVAIATVSPVGSDKFRRTGFVITPIAATRGYSGTVLVRVIDRSADASVSTNGILITVNVTLMNSKPFVKDGMDTTTITLVGTSNEKANPPESKTLSIGDYIGDPNDTTDIVGPDSKYQANTYLRIYSSRYVVYEQLYSNVEQVKGGNSDEDQMNGSAVNSLVDSSALFTFSISGDYNQDFTLTAKPGYYGLGAIEITVTDGDKNVTNDSEEVRFRINVEVVFNPNEITALNSISTARGKSSVISIDSIIPSIENTIVDENESGEDAATGAVSESGMIMGQKNASPATFNPASAYVLLSVEPASESIDFIKLTHEEGSPVWTLVASKVSIQPKPVNVKYALKSNPDEVYENYFEVTIAENNKPELIYKEITFIRYTDAVENTEFMLNTNNTAMLRPEQIFTDPEGDVLKITSVKSQKPSLIAASVENNGQLLSITFNARGTAKITITVMDETEEAVPLTLTVINKDLPEPSMWMRITSSFEANKVMWAIILGLVVLAIIIMIIIIAVVRKRKREREELEALLVSEMEIEEQMLKLAGGPTPTGYQSFGYLQQPLQPPVDP
ncbi:MAG: hypothetical protein J1G04_05815, partial [Clostridiales bacterium]|nr:hypothetical protein [Clostridiales bacterium]